MTTSPTPPPDHITDAVAALGLPMTMPQVLTWLAEHDLASPIPGDTPPYQHVALNQHGLTALSLLLLAHGATAWQRRDPEWRALSLACASTYRHLLRAHMGAEVTGEPGSPAYTTPLAADDTHDPHHPPGPADA